MSIQKFRRAEHEVAPLFVNRWSPRAYTGTEIPTETLFSIFEAARWAPSSRNVQPWRFLYAKRQTPNFATFIDFLAEQNQLWARQASALIVLLSAKTFLVDGKEKPLASHSFDSGAAWANLSLQANLLGWHTHAIGGFDQEKTRRTLKIPESFAIEVVIAIGKIGEKESLPSALQDREIPTSRRPLQELVTEGIFRL
jgi:nitroreductase